SQFICNVKNPEKNSSNQLNIFLYFKKFGEVFEVFISNVALKNTDTVLFFEDGFSEYLINAQTEVKNNVPSFKAFLAMEHL
ncbi:MAG: hypothetical protein NTU49_02520, partial [Gammaproteobacteria bacterium]|nr:hypothetical protein [Gammaproteobacteria bacterium]